MRTTEVMTISLPPELLRQFEEVRKRESRTRSELVREALRVYFEQRYPMVQPTRAEIAALRRGRKAASRGDSVSLSEFLNGLEPANYGTRTKRISQAPRKGSAAR